MSLDNPAGFPALETFFTLNQTTAAAFKKLHCFNVWDLLLHLPTRYFDYRKSASIQEALATQQPVRMRGRLACSSWLGAPPSRTHLYFLNEYEETVQLHLFHAHRFPLRFLLGKTFDIFGQIRQYKGSARIDQPKWQTSLTTPTTLTPVYGVTKGVSQQQLRLYIQQALLWLKSAIEQTHFQTWDAYFPQPDLLSALQMLHGLKNLPSIDLSELNTKTSAAHRRLYLEEWTLYYCRLLQSDAAAQSLPSTFCGTPIQLRQSDGCDTFAQPAPTALTVTCQSSLQHFFDQLPFALTPGQMEAIQQILKALSTPEKAMFALLSGEVGSGKTVVAAAALLYTLLHNKQGVLLAPSLLLAQQHFQTIGDWFQAFGYDPLLWTSATKSKQKGIDILNAPLIIGTHALLNQSIDLPNLGLLVIDEQHRFGVMQRSQLLMTHKNRLPHQLLISATPIPRTLQMCETQSIQLLPQLEKPPQRPPVKVTLLSDRKISLLLERLREKIRRESSLQLYWVCARVKNAQKEGRIGYTLMDVEQRAQTISEAIPEAKIAILHGQLSVNEQFKIIEAFQRGTLNMLICTTVIEVGIDIPNADLIIIEDAQQLGLAQLHQLRGRIGRAQRDTWTHCILLFTAPLSESAKFRLLTVREKLSGLEVAAADAKLRGSGQWLGKAQAGFTSALRLGDERRDQPILHLARALAKELNEQPALKEMITRLSDRWPGIELRYRFA